MLGDGRGGGTSGDPEPTAPRDRAREFFVWFNQGHSTGSRLAYLRAEHATASRLGLLLQHGRWEDLRAGFAERGVQILTLVFDADSHSPIGIIEMSRPGDGRLYLEDEFARRRP